MAHQAGAYPGFSGMERPGVFLLPLIGISLVPIYTPGWREALRVKCLVQERNAMSPARAQTRTSGSRVDYSPPWNVKNLNIESNSRKWKTCIKNVRKSANSLNSFGRVPWFQCLYGAIVSFVKFCNFGTFKVVLWSNFYPLIFWAYHLEFHERMKTPFTVCKYLH